ncbi:hypothetical protein Bpfe_028556 [Biomphalaria pfeifferi]|uniref:Uncharacterized protein n=1 Tax=Biomphalaria pfeifferi TaxID=112525 RepID=A0AAD8AUR6_BIOPF|nr:hypothetical protein Bpfe_028556 [Biomphalaria pfeifferi]
MHTSQSKVHPMLRQRNSSVPPLPVEAAEDKTSLVPHLIDLTESRGVRDFSVAVRKGSRDDVDTHSPTPPPPYIH